MNRMGGRGLQHFELVDVRGGEVVWRQVEGLM